jgi:3-hydroxy-9,10-secoandrosta-1,3,5(10)-triene-9,17-dione monooxygenase reductase component
MVEDAAADDVLRPGGEDFRTVLGQFATGVTIITAMDGAEPAGVAANAFTSVSLDPPLVLFCVARTSTTWPRIERARRFAVNILGEHQEELSRLFATKGADRFGQTEYDGGDHIIVVGRVLDLGVSHHAGPLVFFRGEYVRVSR